MYETEEVSEEEAKQLADDLKAIFQFTSAKESTGIEDLFKKIGKKLLDPKSEHSENDKNTGKSGKKDNIKLNQKNAGDKPKKGCC